MSRTEAKAFFDAYADCFTRGDVEGVMDRWLLPAFISGSGGKSGSFADRDQFSANTRKLCEFYAAQGVMRAEKTVLNVQELFDDVALVRTGDRLSDENDATVAEWEHVYMLRRGDSEWKVFLAVADGELDAWNAHGTPLGSRSPQ
jgi:hypothetical protein